LCSEIIQSEHYLFDAMIWLAVFSYKITWHVIVVYNSTQTCLIHLFDLIKSQISEALYIAMVMVDLQNVFNTIDHQILFNKLQTMEVSNI